MTNKMHSALCHMFCCIFNLSLYRCVNFISFIFSPAFKVKKKRLSFIFFSFDAKNGTFSESNKAKHRADEEKAIKVEFIQLTTKKYKPEKNYDDESFHAKKKADNNKHSCDDID